MHHEHHFQQKKYSAWPAALSTTEGQFEQYRDRLGNLTLLESGKNVSVGANPFEKKREVYTTSKVQMTQNIADDYSKWNIDQIDNRTSELANAIAQIWSLDS